MYLPSSNYCSIYHLIYFAAQDRYTPIDSDMCIRLLYVHTVKKLSSYLGGDGRNETVVYLLVEDGGEIFNM